jgi:hypothetical protein
MKSNDILNNAVRTSLRTSMGYSEEEARKYSILECHSNDYLDPEFDSFKLLHAELFVDRLRKGRISQE